MKIRLLAVLSFVLSFSVIAENSKTEQGYEIHYIALSTSFLDPKVATSYKIARSKTKGFINISVLKQNGNKLSIPSEANIIITAKNFYGQEKEVNLRMINENNEAIYYIGVFSVSSREVITFKAQINPKDTDKAIDIKFNQEFFTD